jgi:hypothetical protein
MATIFDLKRGFHELNDAERYALISEIRRRRRTPPKTTAKKRKAAAKLHKEKTPEELKEKLTAAQKAALIAKLEEGII